MSVAVVQRPSFACIRETGRWIATSHDSTPIHRLLHLIRSLRLGKDVKTQKHAERLYEMCTPQLHPYVLVSLCWRKDKRPVVKLYRNPVKDYSMYVHVYAELNEP